MPGWVFFQAILLRAVSFDAVTSEALSEKEISGGVVHNLPADPLADLVGEIEHLDDKDRVRVLLEITSGRMRVAPSDPGGAQLRLHASMQELQGARQRTSTLWSFRSYFLS